MSISHPTNRIDMFSSCFCTEKWKNPSSSANIKDYFVLDKKATLGDNILIRFCPNNIFKHFLQSVRENNWHKSPLWIFLCNGKPTAWETIHKSKACSRITYFMNTCKTKNRGNISLTLRLMEKCGYRVKQNQEG